MHIRAFLLFGIALGLLICMLPMNVFMVVYHKAEKYIKRPFLSALAASIVFMFVAFIFILLDSNGVQGYPFIVLAFLMLFLIVYLITRKKNIRPFLSALSASTSVFIFLCSFLMPRFHGESVGEYIVITPLIILGFILYSVIAGLIYKLIIRKPMSVKQNIS